MHLINNFLKKVLLNFEDFLCDSVITQRFQALMTLYLKSFGSNMWLSFSEKFWINLRIRTIKTKQAFSNGFHGNKATMLYLYFFLEISPSHRNSSSFKCTVLKTLNSTSDFLRCKDTFYNYLKMAHIWFFQPYFGVGGGKFVPVQIFYTA